jgi:DNA-binding beta-propeller fold protein YncE
MLALIYLGLAIYLGDLLCRRFYRFVSRPHRWAAGVLVGLLLTTWFTYLTAWLFSHSRRPLFWADIVFGLAAIGAIFLLRRRSKAEPEFIQPPPPGSERWDWITLGAYLALACWMMFGTFNIKDGLLRIGNNEWSDFGPNTAIAQSFAVGHNFPTQYPHFSGEPIRYHFLFYFEAGNLEFLGLDLAWSLNLLSIITLVSMLALVMSLGQLLFNSRAVGRIGSALFFFHGTLSFVGFLRAQPSIAAAFHSILTLNEFLPSGYTYRGELWGIWTQVVFLNQRHFASGVGILLIVLIFLMDKYRQSVALKPRKASSLDNAETTPLPNAEALPVPQDPSLSPGETETMAEPQESAAVVQSTVASEKSPWRRVSRIARNTLAFDGSFLFSGFLLGCLPLWNALVFTTSFALLSCLFLLFPARKYLLGLGLATALVSLPQLALLRSGGGNRPVHSLLHWGYIVEQPTINNVLRYIGFSFGLKWVLIIVALTFASWFHRRLFLALCSLIAVTFCLEFSVETLANHKFLNVWLIVSNLFAAYGLWQLWHVRSRWLAVATRLVALLLVLAIVVSGTIDFFPIHNSYYTTLHFVDDRLIKWVRSNTKTHDVFLSDRFVNHQVLLAGRRLFYGWPSFPWSAGYDTTLRDEVYRQLFESTDPNLVFRLLQENKIAYVAIDDGVRRGEFIKRPNEELYDLNFQKVWEDKTSEYASLVIYRVPPVAPKEFKRPDPAHLEAQLLAIPPVTMFQGGKGAGRGQFDFPRGMTVDISGNIFVADTSNGRIQKFSSAGEYRTIIGKMGRSLGQLDEPNGIAVDRNGDIYVAEVGNQRVQKLSAEGRFIAQWKGPDAGFYGPRDICVSADNFIYVVDQGRARIVKFNPTGGVVAIWGSQGQGDGQFNEPTAVSVDANNARVYVADPRNRRIQVFDTSGKFITKWTVNEWQVTGWAFQDLLVDQENARLYVTSPTTDEILVFDLDGTRIGQLKPKPPDKLEGASALALWKGKLYVLCTFADRVTTIDLETK